LEGCGAVAESSEVVFVFCEEGFGRGDEGLGIVDEGIKWAVCDFEDGVVVVVAVVGVLVVVDAFGGVWFVSRALVVRVGGATKREGAGRR